jgi:hypothetical protein
MCIRDSYFHYQPLDHQGYIARGRSAFPLIRDHVLLPFAGHLAAAHELTSTRLSAALFDRLVGWLPDAWLDDGLPLSNPGQRRAAYAGFLSSRLAFSPHFVEEAQRARSQLL